MNGWGVFVVAVVATLLFRWQGDSWPVTMIKLAALVLLALAAIVVLVGLGAWLS